MPAHTITITRNQLSNDDMDVFDITNTFMRKLPCVCIISVGAYIPYFPCCGESFYSMVNQKAASGTGAVKL